MQFHMDKGLKHKISEVEASQVHLCQKEAEGPVPGYQRTSWQENTDRVRGLE